MQNETEGGYDTVEEMRKDQAKFYCGDCDELIMGHADITIHKTRNAGSHTIIER